MTVRLHLPRATAVDSPWGRACAWCGGEIDPIDWCLDCQKAQAPCRQPHKRLRRRTDAAFCGDECRSMQRSSYISDCLTAEERRQLRS